MTLRKLRSLVEPPQSPTFPANKYDCAIFQDKHGISLPEDYVDFCNVYGSGSFEIGRSDIFYVFNFADPDYQSQMIEFLGYYRQYKHEVPNVPFDIFPSCPGALPLGSDTRVVNFCYITNPTRNAWEIMYFFRDMSEFYAFDGSLPDFVFSALTWQLNPNLFLENERGLPIRFVPVLNG